MRIAIVDDEKIYRDQIEKLIKGFDNECEVFQFSSSEEFLNEDFKRFHLVFLDIEMGEINGVEAGAYARSKGASFIIFYVTSHSSYISKALRNKPFQYLSKPIEGAEFLIEFKRALQMLKFKNKKVNLKFRGEVAAVSIRKIKYIESKDRKLYFFSEDNKEYTSTGKIEVIEKDLSLYGFISVHKSYIVNMKYIEEIQESEVVLSNEVRVPMSRSKRQMVKTKFNTYIERELI